MVVSSFFFFNNHLTNPVPEFWGGNLVSRLGRAFTMTNSSSSFGHRAASLLFAASFTIPIGYESRHSPHSGLLLVGRVSHPSGVYECLPSHPIPVPSTIIYNTG